jgi:hypothetical protein
MSVSGKHLVDTATGDICFVPQSKQIEYPEEKKVDATARKLLSSSGQDNILSGSSDECTEATDTPSTSPQITHNHVDRTQIAAAMDNLDSHLAKLVTVAKELVVHGEIRQTSVASSFDPKGKKISAKKQASRIYLMGSEDSRISIRPADIPADEKSESLKGSKNPKALLRIDGKEVYVSLKGLSNRLHLPIEELTAAAKDNCLEKYLISKTSHIKTLSFTLSVFKKIAKTYDQMDLRDASSKEQTLKVIQAAFLTSLKSEEGHVFYLGLNGSELKRAEINTDFFMNPLQSKILIHHEKDSNKVNFYHKIKVLGAGSFAVVDRVMKFSVNVRQIGVLKTELSRSNLKNNETSLDNEYDFHTKLRGKLGSRKLSGIQESPKVIRSVMNSNVFALFYKEYNLGSLEKCLAELSPEDKISVCHQLLEAFREFEGLEISHYDIKPANILVQRDQNGVRAVIGDFGGAKFKEDITDIQPHTTAYTFLPDFEDRIEAHDLDRKYEISHAHDIFSMGCTLFYLFTGKELSSLKGCQRGILGIKFSELKDLKSGEKTVEGLLQDTKAPPAIIKLIGTMLQPDQKKRAQWTEIA